MLEEERKFKVTQGQFLMDSARLVVVRSQKYASQCLRNIPPIHKERKTEREREMHAVVKCSGFHP